MPGRPLASSANYCVYYNDGDACKPFPNGTSANLGVRHKIRRLVDMTVHVRLNLHGCIGSPVVHNEEQEDLNRKG